MGCETAGKPRFTGGIIGTAVYRRYLYKSATWVLDSGAYRIRATGKRADLVTV